MQPNNKITRLIRGSTSEKMLVVIDLCLIWFFLSVIHLVQNYTYYQKNVVD